VLAGVSQFSVTVARSRIVGGRVVQLHSWRPKRKPLKIKVVEK